MPVPDPYALYRACYRSWAPWGTLLTMPWERAPVPPTPADLEALWNAS